MPIPAAYHCELVRCELPLEIKPIIKKEEGLMHTLQQASLEETRTFLQDYPDGRLINVLTRESFAKQRIPGSVGACVFEIAFPEQVKKLVPDKNTPLLLYGAGESEDSRVAGQKLLHQGYADVRVFSGGLQEWKQQGLPLEGNNPQDELSEAPVHPQFRDYTLLTDQSVIRWVGRNRSHSHNGTLRFREGELHFPEGEKNSGKGFLKLNMDSIDSDDLAGSAMLPVLIAHLKSDDFFDVEHYPSAEMRITELDPLPAGSITCMTHHLCGALHLLRTERAIECDAALRNLPENQLGLFCQLNWDRTLWEVKYGSARFFRFLGMHSVDDIVSLDVALFFKAQ